MTREEIIKLVNVTVASYPTRRYTQQEVQLMVDAWDLMLGGCEYQDVAIALKAFVSTDTSGFMPTVGQINEQMRKLKNGNVSEQLSDMMAWAIVRDAISDGIYHSEERFEKMPEPLQRAVGTAKQLYLWATDESFNAGVIQSHVLKCYRNELERQKYDDRLPQDVKMYIAQHTKNLLEANNGT